VLLLTALVLALGAAPADKPAPVLVYVTSAGALHGFTDPDKGSTDTVKDLKRGIKYHKKTMVLTEDPTRATLVLVVKGRETTGLTGFGRDRVIRVTLRYAEQESELTAAAAGGTMGSGGAWTTAAQKLVSQLHQWVQVNRAALTPAAQSPAGSPPR